MKVLVTGPEGFVGGHVVECLSAVKHEVDIVTRTKGYMASSYDTVVHCAAAAGPWHTAQDILRDNIEYTDFVLRHTESKLFIFMSSTSVTQSTPYGISKLFCEHLIEASGRPAISLRCPGIVGPRTTGRNWLVRLAQQIKTQDKIPLHDPTFAFNAVVHVADVAALIAKLVQRTDIIGHHAFELAAEFPIPIAQAAGLLATGLGKTPLWDIYKEDSPSGQPRIISNRVARAWGFLPMDVDETIARYASEVRDEPVH